MICRIIGFSAFMILGAVLAVFSEKRWQPKAASYLLLIFLWSFSRLYKYVCTIDVVSQYHQHVTKYRIKVILRKYRT